MASAVNTGARLDRLPISSFHYRIFWLIGAGMFFDGYDLYVGASVLGAAVQKVRHARSGPAVHLLDLRRHDDRRGDRRLPRRSVGRRFTYQFNLLVFGAASFAAAAAPGMDWLIAARFVWAWASAPRSWSVTRP